MTFSIVAFDRDTGDLGVAVQSKFPNAGVSIPFARAGVGAVATQAYCNTGFGPRGLVLLENGASPQQALEVLVRSDPERDYRQLGIVDAQGRYFIGEEQVVNSQLKTLKGAIAKVLGDRTDMPVIVRADANSPHQSVVTVLDATSQLGLTRISLATTRSTSE